MLRQLPNFLTVSRVCVIPLIVASFYINTPVLSHWIAAGLFAFASITDFFDGYLARAWSVQSRFGRFLDPVADKLLVAAVILMLVHKDIIVGWDIIPALAIVCREILVSGLREFLAELNVSMPVSRLGKVKTTAQMVALFLLLLGPQGAGGLEMVDIIARMFLWVSAVLTIVSGYVYFQAGLKHMSEE
ncbi:MAG: CDP-diacylglycerol-glycerol-3-phosphate 3-phosphatidyltransferase protein [Rickettsiales bacterium]|jgi:CDP-diacylglycerol--glycerol-3-phosphate 3-phosphatidyltransferase|nr:CDP-diacylglycerol-glycerol-3-phosphate 3-phosphatidyltransferase protein [Rickettsiales bacterium]